MKTSGRRNGARDRRGKIANILLQVSRKNMCPSGSSGTDKVGTERLCEGEEQGEAEARGCWVRDKGGLGKKSSTGGIQAEEGVGGGKEPWKEFPVEAKGKTSS